MRSSFALALGLGATLCAATTTSSSSASLSPSQLKWRRAQEELQLEVPDVNPKRYIVELSSLSCSDRVKDRVADLDGIRIVKTFDHELFPAVSVECDNGCDGDSLARLLDVGAGGRGETTGGDVAAVYKSSTMELNIPEQGESFSDDAAAPKYSFHGLTGVEDLHKAGIVGEGATVAIVDSGCEWQHPDLGGCFGPGCKVIGGYDFIGDTDWPHEPAKPDDFPDDQFGHGTHVAGIVAGKGKQFVGVAPGAKILCYKVIGQNGQSNEEMVIEGFLKAYDSGADVITASLGEKSGWATNAWARVASRMVDNGVMVTIAGGNDGEDGAFLMSNGAAGDHVLTVAAAHPELVPAYPFSAQFGLDGETNKSELGYSPSTVNGFPNFFPDTIRDWPIVPLTLNSSVEADACQPLGNSSSLPNLKDSLLLVRIGGCDMWQKIQNLVAAQVPYVLFYQDSSPYSVPADNPKIRMAVVDRKAGAAVVDTILEGGKVTASFNESTKRYVGMVDASAGRPAIFTQWGPNYDLKLKPDIMAPGAKILSTYIHDTYRVLSGTSMATPYVAGVAALYIGKHGGRKAHAGDPDWAKRLMSRIMSTARNAPWVDEQTNSPRGDFLAPPVQVGAGLLNAVKVFDATTTFGFDGRKFELNDTAHFQPKHSVDITNAGHEPVTYKFELEPAAGFNSWNPKPPGEKPAFGWDTFKYYFELQPLEITPDVSMPGEMTIQPGQSATANFEFSIPENINTTSIPLYGGRILIHASNGQDFAIPYYGVGSDIKEVVPGNWDRSYGLPRVLSGLDGKSIQDKTTLSFNLSRASQDFPLLVSQVAYGCQEIRWDIFDPEYTEADWQYPPVVGEKHYVGSATAWTGSMSTSYFDPASNNASDVFAFPRYDIARSKATYYMWLGQFANGSHIQPGQYNFRLAALRPFGDRHVASDWDVYQTPLITVVPLNNNGSTNITNPQGKRSKRSKPSRINYY